MDRLVLLFILFLTTPAFAKLHETAWEPDTCDCRIIYQWDDSAPVETRTNTFLRFEKKCAAYAGLSDQDAYNAILAENQCKNKAVNRIMAAYSNLTVHDIKFSYDSGRKLILTVPKLTPSQKSNAQGLVDHELGEAQATVQ